MRIRSALFLSYAHADELVALRVYEALTQAGRDVWLDLESLEPATDWWKGVKAAIDRCTAVLFLASDESSGSVSCSRELAYAAAQAKRIVAIGIDPALR